MAVPLVPTLVATALAFLLGGIWYGPLFGQAWMTEHDLTSERIKSEFSPAKTYGATFALALLSAVVLGFFLGPDPTPLQGVGFGLAIGLCWVAGSIGTNYLFSGNSMRLFLIDGGYHTVRFMLMGLAFGLM
jgi:Protein of unknown function (DUF1761)